MTRGTKRDHDGSQRDNKDLGLLKQKTAKKHKPKNTTKKHKKNTGGAVLAKPRGRRGLWERQHARNGAACGPTTPQLAAFFFACGYGKCFSPSNPLLGVALLGLGGRV